jgi:hypothetical protein
LAKSPSNPAEARADNSLVNVFRSLARDVLNFASNRAQAPVEAGAKTLAPLRERRVPPVLGTSRFLDAFDQFPQGARGNLRTLAGERAFRPQFSASPARSLQTDGFERATPRAVDLSGGLSSPRPSSDNGFVASLDDLAS